MTYSLLWMPRVLKDAGLKIIEVPGWQNRGHGDEGKVLGVLCHHTCGPLHGNLPDIKVLVDGRPDLGGPLCNLGLGRDGTFYIIAAGKGWHAGAGNWQGVKDGNGHFIGIEAENTGEKTGPRADPWPAVQMDAYKRGVAAILTHIGAKPIMCAGHKEYALPRGRKDDPDFDMGKFRADVAALMATPAAPAPMPDVPSVPPASDSDSDESDPVTSPPRAPDDPGPQAAPPDALPDEVQGPSEHGLWALLKRWKGRLLGSGGGAVGFGFFQPEIFKMVLISAGVVLVIGVIVVICLFGRAKVAATLRGWIRRQVIK